MEISIIIVNYNTKNFLEKCLKTIIANVFGINFEIIVIDNNSNDKSDEMIKKNFPQVKLIKNKKNVGFGKACNQGAKIAQGEILFFLNPDTIINEDIFIPIINKFKKNPKIAIISPSLVLPNGSEQPWAYGKNQKGEIIWVSGAALAIRKEIFKKISGFDENFFAYFEDKDLCLRVKKLGYKIVILPNIKVIHFGGKSLKSQWKRKKFYYQSQNYFWRKHYGLIISLILRLIRWPYKILIYFLSKQKVNQK